MKPLSDPRTHAAAATLTLLLALAVMYAVIVAPAIGMRREVSVRIETARSQRDDFARAAARMPALEAEVRELKSRGIDRGGFLESPSPALAAAELQRAVKAIVESHGGTVVSTQVMPDSAQRPIHPVGIRVQIRARVEGVVLILHELAAHQPVVILNDLVLQPLQGRDPERAALVDIRFEATAFLYERAAG